MRPLHPLSLSLFMLQLPLASWHWEQLVFLHLSSFLFFLSSFNVVVFLVFADSVTMGSWSLLAGNS